MQLVWLVCWQGVQKFVLLAARWMHLCPSTNEWHWWQVSSNAWSTAARDPPPSRTTFDDCSLVPCINSCWWCWRWRASFSADDDPPSTRLELAAISDSNNNKPITDINDFDAIFLHENTLFLTLSPFPPTTADFLLWPFAFAWLTRLRTRYLRLNYLKYLECENNLRITCRCILTATWLNV